MSKEKRLALYEYPTSLSSPKIEPVDLTLFKRYSVTKANDYFGGKWEDLVEEAEILKETIELNERIYSCKYNFEPKVGHTYHIYEGRDGREFLSIISPDEWNMKHVISVRLNSDSVWKKIQINSK
jgi:hypothetical protein